MVENNKLKAPYHLGIIIDGNRRWAKQHNLPTLEGHRRGYNKVQEICEYALLEKGVKILTVYCFSSENWNRSKEEVNYLMKLLASALIDKNIKKYHKKGIKLKIIGQIEKLPKFIQDKAVKAEKLTAENKNGLFNLAISYGGRPEIISAFKKIIKEKIPANMVNEEMFNNYLWTNGLPDPDMIIRSGGEQRLSNFLTWQSVYSELYFIKKFWPDFTKKDLDLALFDYSKRQKRFGR